MSLVSQKVYIRSTRVWTERDMRSIKKVALQVSSRKCHFDPLKGSGLEWSVRVFLCLV